MVSARRSLQGLLLVALAAALAGCSNGSPRTEVLVVVDTDVRGPDGIDNLFVEVTSPAGDRQTSTATLGAGELPLPRSIGLLWETGPLGPFTVRVVGNSGGRQRVVRTARFEFQRNQTLVLAMHLLARCESTACPVAETCAEAGCRSIDVSPSELVPWSGVVPGLDGAVPIADAGPVDASGPDAAGVDGGPRPDGGVDAAMLVDACAPIAELCNTRDDDCDGMTDEEFDLDTDELNCGTCGHACDFANATGSCVAGACVITACSTGFDDCNVLGDDGCEIDLTSDPDHCGSCTMICAVPDRECCASTCLRRCP